MLGVGAHERLEQKFPWGRHCVACSSGTAALHLALEALRLPVGSRVAMPDYAMIACARAVILAGHTPVFVRWDSRLLMDLDALDAADFDAVMAVHIYGRRLDMDALHAVARKRGASVVEDMAELHGFRPHADTTAACWSFYRNKVVAGEEGGLVEFRERELAAHAKQLRCLGFTAKHDFLHVPRGHNYRLANSLAEIVLASLRCYEANIALRREAETAYELECPPAWRMPKRDCPWVYDVRIPGINAETQDTLVSCVPGARHGFKPMSQQPEFRSGQTARSSSCVQPSEVLYLPLLPPAPLPFRALSSALCP